MEVSLPEVVQAGIDTVSFYLPMEGSGVVHELSQLPGRRVAYGGLMLGEDGSWGEWANKFGFRAIWYEGSKRLSLYPRLAPADALCPIAEFDERVTEVIERLAAIGVISYGRPYLKRLDVAADARFSCQRTARNFLQAVHGCRVPRGGRTEALGDPIGTVYLLPRTGKDKLGRVYDKGRQMHERAARREAGTVPEPYTLIRIEAVYRFKSEQVALEFGSIIARALWQRRFMTLAPDERERTVVIPFDQLRARIVQSVRTGELRPAQGERMRLFLELEGTGEAEGYYGPKQFSDRRREARKLGLRVEDAGRQAQDFDLEAILRAYDESPLWGEVGHEIAAAPGSRATVAA
jgi:hypothetical protein